MTEMMQVWSEISGDTVATYQGKKVWIHATREQWNTLLQDDPHHPLRYNMPGEARARSCSVEDFEARKVAANAFVYYQDDPTDESYWRDVT